MYVGGIRVSEVNRGTKKKEMSGTNSVLAAQFSAENPHYVIVSNDIYHWQSGIVPMVQGMNILRSSRESKGSATKSPTYASDLVPERTGLSALRDSSVDVFWRPLFQLGSDYHDQCVDYKLNGFRAGPRG